MPLRIDYVSEGFPAGAPVANGPAVLNTSWDEILWAAITVGRPNRQYVFQHGKASMYEALFRLSLVRMALEQSGPGASRLRRTTAARTLDPSEKGAINYFLGLTICKLFAARLLSTPWVLHLDVFRPMLNAVLSGRSRPDLVGRSTGGNWVSLECKGRVSPPDVTAKSKAKQQAQRLVSVNGQPLAFRVGGIAYFRKDVLQFIWSDPEPSPLVKKPIELTVRPDLWQDYYTPVLDLIRSDPAGFEAMQQEPRLIGLSDPDIQIGIHPAVLRALLASRWEEARHLAEGGNVIKGTSLPYRGDGIAVISGETWTYPFAEPGDQGA